MNTASLMTISPQAGAAVKSQTPRMVVKTDASSAGMGKETFGDVLGKAGEETKKTMAKSPAEAQGSAVEARDAKINDDVPEGMDVLPKEAGKQGEGMPQDSELQQVKTVKGPQERITDAEEQGMAPAAVMAFTTEGNAQLVQEDIPEAGTVQPLQNLQSLLPQSSEDAQKNKNFLAMLSGQQIKAQGLAKDAGQAVNNQAAIEQAFSTGSKTAKETPLTAELLFKQMGMAPVKEEGTARAGTLLEVQLGNHRLANQLPNMSLQEVPNGKISVEMAANQEINLSDSGRDTMLNAKGMALFQQSEVTMPSRAAGEVIDQTQWQQIGADIRNADINLLAEEGVTEPRLQVTGNQATLPETVKIEAVSIGEGETIPLAEESGQDLRKTLNSQQVRNRSFLTPNDGQGVNAQEAAVLQGGTRTLSPEMQPVSSRQESPLPMMNINQAVDDRQVLRDILPEQRWVASEQGTVIRMADRNQSEGTTVLESQIAALGENTKENLIPANQGADMQQMGSRQDPNSRQQLPFTPPPVEQVVDTEGQAVHQLAEEAAGDKAPMTKGQEVHDGPVSVFQQDLADSVRGIERQPDIPQNRDVQDNFQVVRQIIDQARLIRRGDNTEMVIKLHPDHLGELTLKVSVSANGAVNASFHSDNAQVRTIIENSLVQLRQELNNQGLKVDNVDVYAGLTDGQLPQGEGQQAWQQGQGHNAGANNIGTGNPEDYGEETEMANVVADQDAGATDGVDYRI
ncbi:flagellar hook-length control protein FliK [Selenomonas ruminantium]|uniref:Flagellar hook-length control protein FliK n=1 Tax=Selenomonas ruminantium TaxID=971 RepID=A0A1M6R7T4_SELRU|nr:flagellar hook-length control protein FliK [Selenomonas ruminantium]SHK28513.1 flagellar hook-length control protein FliK [Selenomonas ruminantium]